MKPPRIWRKKRGGKYYGDCIVTVAGEEVRLGTKNFKIAQERLPAALKGARTFESDAAAAAAALEPDVGELAGGDTGPVAEGTIPIAPASSQPPAPAPLQLPAAAPANDTNAQAEAEATNAAAAETGGAGAEQPGSAAAPDAIFPPEALDGMLVAVAGAVVELQLELQGWAIKKRTGGKVPGKVPEDSQIRVLAAQAWVAQLKRWFPDMDTVPPWVVAVALPLMCMPAQLAHATDPPKTPEKQADPEPVQAAA